MNGGAVTEDEPCVTPALPDELNDAPIAVLWELTSPEPLFEGKPALMPASSNVSVGNPSEFVDVPALRTIGAWDRMTVCVVGLVSLAIVGASLLPVTVN